MKKAATLAIVVVSCMVLGTRADIVVNWTTQTNFQTPDGILGINDGVPASEDALFQLIWSTTDPGSYVVDINNTDGLAADEVLLDSLTSTELGLGQTNQAGNNVNQTTAVITDGDVGADVNTGYLYIRIFNDATLADATYYYQGTVIAPALTEYVASDPASIISAAVTDTGVQMTSVPVPEPGTMLLAMAGLGVFLRKRLTKRS